MRFVTSSFNATLYKKNLTRFWPLWVVYTLIFAFMMPMQVLIQGDSTGYPQAERIYDTLWWFARYSDSMLAIPLVFGVLIAMAVFSYLYSSRSACMIHALPISRRALYLTNYLSGLTMLIIPNLLILGTTLAAGLSKGLWEPTPVLAWFVAQSCAGVFFFSFASFCTMFTGNLFALPVFYGVLNCLVVGIGALLMPLLESLLYGFQSYSTSVMNVAQWLTPMWNMMGSGITQSIREYDAIKSSWIQVGYQIVNLDIFLTYLIAGLVIAVLGYLVYCRFETERAGDVVAEIRVHSLFRYGVGFCGGLSMGLLNTVLLGLDTDSSTVMMILSVLWGVIFYFVSEMLLQKSFKIFKKAYQGALVFGLVMTAVFGCIAMDVIGFEDNIPQLEDIQSAYIQLGTYGDSYSIDTSDQEMLTLALALHQAIVDEGVGASFSDENQTATTCRFYYTLENGDYMTRSFDVVYYRADLGVAGTVTQCADDLLSDDDFRRVSESLDMPDDAIVTDVALSCYWNGEEGQEDYFSVQGDENRALVLAAVRQDFAQGCWTEYFLFGDDDYYDYQLSSYSANLEIGYLYYYGESTAVMESDVPITVEYTYGSGDYASSYINLDLNPSCTHTIAALYEIGVLDENNYLVTDSELDELYEKTEYMG